MNEVAELTVQYVNQPKEGKKWGSIKSSEGASYFGPPGLLKEFSVGEVARVEWKPFGENAKAIVRKLFNGDANAKPKQIIRPTTSKSDSEQIFVVALAKEYISRGDIAADTESVVKLVNSLRNVWRQTFGGATSQVDQGMNDEIPY